MYDVYVADEYKLDMGRFFDRSNAAAKQQMVARLLEVDRQGTYRFSVGDRNRLVSEYVRLVSVNGVACSANVCGNGKLTASVIAQARAMSADRLSPEDLEEFERQFKEATRPQQVSQIVPRLNRRAPRRNPFAGMKIKTITV